MTCHKTKYCSEFHLCFYYEEEVGAWVDFSQPNSMIEHVGKAYRTAVENGENDPFVLSVSQFKSVDSFKKSSKCLPLNTSSLCTGKNVICSYSTLIFNRE